MRAAGRRATMPTRRDWIGTAMHWDYEKTPQLWSFFDWLGSGYRHEKGRRRIQIYEHREIPAAKVLLALNELREGNAGRATASDIAAIAGQVGRVMVAKEPEAPLLMSTLREVLTLRRDLTTELAAVALTYRYNGRDVLQALSNLVAAPEMLDAICDALDDDDLEYVALDLKSLAVPTRAQARRLLAHAGTRTGGPIRRGRPPLNERC